MFLFSCLPFIIIVCLISSALEYFAFMERQSTEEIKYMIGTYVFQQEGIIFSSPAIKRNLIFLVSSGGSRSSLSFACCIRRLNWTVINMTRPQKHRLVSKKLWHNEDPFLLKKRRHRAKVYILKSCSSNVSLWITNWIKWDSHSVVQSLIKPQNRVNVNNDYHFKFTGPSLCLKRENVSLSTP